MKRLSQKVLPIRGLGLIFFAFTILFPFNSCKNGLISDIDTGIISGGTSSGARLVPPDDLTATHGQKGVIQLDWSPKSDAYRYAVYSAVSPAAGFTKIGELKNSEGTGFYDFEKPGVSKYYKVSSIDKQGRESELSLFVYGSTISQPVITSIEQDSKNETAPVTLNWWMMNCNEETYRKYIHYEVSCYTDSEGKNKEENIQIEYDNQSCRVYGLKPKTTYYYQVKAWTECEGLVSASELSLIVDAETAHKVIPDAAGNLTAAKGSSIDAVDVSFTLPDFIDFKNGNLYDQKPLYFEISRKVKNDDAGRFEKIAVIKSASSTDAATAALFTGFSENLMYYFDCLNEKSTECLSVTKGSYDGYNYYPYYIPGSVIVFHDTTAERGEQYEYKVQSFTDDVKPVVSSDNSIAMAEGWKLAELTLTQTTVITNNELDSVKIARIEVQLNLDFETYGRNYTFIRKQTGEVIDVFAEDEPVEKEEILTLEVLNSKPLVFEGEDLVSHRGYYRYEIFVLPEGETEIASAIDSVILAEKIIVVDEEYIKLRYFEVEDGYSNKFILKWDYDSDYTYIITWRDIVSAGEELADDDTIVIKPGEGESQGWVSDYSLDAETEIKILSFEHKGIPAGINREYTLKAIRGMQKEQSVTGKKTIGQVVPVFDEYDYRTLKVKWNSVQLADKYVVNAVYEDGTEILNSERVITADGNRKFEVVYSDDESDPENPVKWTDYDNPAVSGKNIIVTVKALNTATEASGDEGVLSKVTAYTMGPACIDVQVPENTFSADTIQIKWKKIIGARYYKIQRVLYASEEAKTVSKSSFYLFDSENGTISINGEDPDGKEERVKIEEKKGYYYLKDIYKEPDASNEGSYQIQQSQIPFGLPYGYIVLPMLEEDDFTFNDKTLMEGSKVLYENLSDVKNSTFGVGRNVYAEKSLNARYQIIYWEKPYVVGSNKTFIYRRPAGSEGAWSFLNENVSGLVKWDYELQEDEKEKAYEYAVVYSTSKENALSPLPSYENYLSETLDYNNWDATDIEKFRENAEQLNKGYLLAVNLNAHYNGTLQQGTYLKDENYYSERVEWAPWDYEKKKLGPDSARIMILNSNLTNGWQNVITLDSSLKAEKGTLNEDLQETRLRINGNSVVLTPDGFVNKQKTNTDGMLKVLRDAKHYYSIELSRTTGTGERKDVKINDDFGCYAYRQITDEEFTKAVMLNIANMVMTLPQIYTNSETKSGLSGGKHNFEANSTDTFKWYKDHNSMGKGDFGWVINRYVQTWTEMPASDFTEVKSFFELNDLNESEEVRGAHNGNENSTSKLRVLSKGSRDFGSLIDVSVTPVQNDLQLETYKGVFRFTCSDSGFKAEIKRGEESVSVANIVNNIDAVKNWSPLRIGNVNTFFGGSDSNAQTYGWWPKSD